MENENIIKCPECGSEINVSEILFHQVEDQLKKDFEVQSAKKDFEIQKKLKSIELAQEQIEKDKESISEQVNSAVKTKVAVEKLNLEKNIRQQLTEETSEQLTSLKTELEHKSNQVKELNQTKIALEQSKRENNELRDTVALEKEIEFTAKLRDEKQKIQKQADESSYLKIKELENQLEVQVRLAEEMKRKAEQGSMQSQGEIQELVLEEILRTIFPFDTIEEVGKGVKGADCIQTVRNKMGEECGTILFESKRTKAFSNEWIKKLKTDAALIKADICVIVTETMPDGMDRIGEKDGVWICTFNDFKGLVLPLRDSLIKISEAFSSQTNKGEKMQMLYDYLTSTEFKNEFGEIIEGFTELQDNYNQERRAMERIWKQREKQLQKVVLNTNRFIGSIKGIAGNSIPDLKQIGSRDNLLDEE